MGGFVDFRCRHCGYEEADIGIGSGRDGGPRLTLFVCESCKSVGSTWTGDDRPVMCSLCYHEHPRLLADDIHTLACPKCGKSAVLIAKEGRWE